MKHVIMFSGGACSWATAKIVAQRHGIADLILLFADTLEEHEDTYRFLHQAAANIGVPLTITADGRDIWQVFKDERFLGNSRVDPCSKILKRQRLDKWCWENLDPANSILYFGIHWSESERFDAIRARLHEWNCQAPLCESPFIGAQEIQDWCAREVPPKQFLYQIGMPHANCGGMCIKMGQKAAERSYRLNRPIFNRWRDKEQEVIKFLGRDDISILTDRSGDGKKKPLTLAEFQRRLESGDQLELDGWGGCGCFAGTLETA